jgi:hypothetical protein
MIFLKKAKPCPVSVQSLPSMSPGGADRTDRVRFPYWTKVQLPFPISIATVSNQLVARC